MAAGFRPIASTSGLLARAYKSRQDVTLASLDEESPGMKPPEHVAVFERVHELLGYGLSQMIGGPELGGLVHDPIDPAVRLVAEVGRRKLPPPRLESGRGRIVLDDIVVPVDHPDLAVGTTSGHGRGGPLVVAGEQVHRIGGMEVASSRFRTNVPTRWPVGSATNAVRFQ